MAGVSRCLLLLLLHAGTFLLISAGARQDRTTVDSSSTARSLSTAGTEAPTAGATAGHAVATTETPKTTTEDTAVSRKQTAAAVEEGPLELGAWILFYEFHFNYYIFLA